MITVVIPTSDSEASLAYTLSSLVPAAADGVVREVVVVDAGSADATLEIADDSGCLIVRDDGGLAGRLKAGARAGTRGGWLLFLRPGAVLEPGWQDEASTFVERAERAGQGRDVAAFFRLQFDEMGAGARLAEVRSTFAARIFAQPLAEQALLVPRVLYDRLGGHRDLPRYEDVDLIRRIGRGRVRMLHAAARVPSRSDLVARRGGLGGALLALRVPPTFLSRIGA